MWPVHGTLVELLHNNLHNNNKIITVYYNASYIHALFTSFMCNEVVKGINGLGRKGLQS